MSCVVDARALRKVYPMPGHDVVALDGVDVRIERGEYVGIMGASGSGKSTLLQLLGCLDTASSGSYTLNGQSVADLDDDALSHLRSTQVGFIFQSFHLIPQLTVWENICLPALYGAPVDAEAVLERVGLSHRREHRPTELSGGEQQRVAIARALATQPSLLLADEPTGNLDSRTGQAILDLLRELHAEGRTLVVVTHDPKVAQECDRVITMQDGRVLHDAT